MKPDSAWNRSTTASGGAVSASSVVGPTPPWWPAVATSRSPGTCPTTTCPSTRAFSAPLELLLERYRAPELTLIFPHSSRASSATWGYDVVREIEKIPETTVDDTGYPDAIIDVIGELAVFDHWRQRVTLVAVALLGPSPSLAEVDAAYDEAVARLDRARPRRACPIDEPMVRPPNESEEVQEADVEALAVAESLSGGLYEKSVEAAKEYIRAGDIFQVVLAKRFSFDLDADPIDVYRVLRQINPSPYMYFIRRPELTLVGCSPEPLVQVQEGRVISRPIAGTRRRGATEQHDRMMAAELAEDPKERAEHVMLVDLARNDVGRVVEFGSLTVDEMMTLERYSHVMHLTSEVSGELAAGKSVIDVLRATMPAGTVSGAPKVRAMEIIDELEPTKRGPYSGWSATSLLRQPRHGDRHPNHGLRPRQGLGPGRSRRRGRQHPREREQGMLEQSQSAPGGGGACPPDERGPAQRTGWGGVVSGSEPKAGIEAALRDGVVHGSVALDVITVGGTDALDYLQGQLSQNVNSLTVGETRWTLLLQPQGKVEAWMRLHRVDADRLWLVVDAGFGDDALARLERFKLRVDVTMTLDRRVAVGLRGPGSGRAAEQFAPDDGVVVVDAGWGPVPGFDLIPDGGEPPVAESESDFGLAVDDQTMELVRVLQGRPSMGRELDASTIPAAAGSSTGRSTSPRAATSVRNSSPGSTPGVTTPRPAWSG